jgi:hypothetical protein
MASRQDLFLALHDYTFTAAGHTWRVEVYSISDDAQRWLQLGIHGLTSLHVRVRVDAARSARDILTHVQRCVEHHDRARLAEDLIID